jgi:hypothetical protein
MRMADLKTPELMVRAALLLDRQDRVTEAIAAYQGLLARWPALPDCWYRLATLQRQARQFLAALASYQEALDRGVRKPEEVHLNRGVIYADHLLRHDAAEAELLAALTLNPAYVPALLNLANLHEDLGRREQALAVYERLLALDAPPLEALARYANLTTFAGLDDPLIGRLQQSLADSLSSAADRASLGFALGRALDACGAYDAAFDAYAEANRASRESAAPGTARYDAAFAERVIDRLIAAFPAAPGAAAPRSGPLPEDAKPRPIFVCGMFRSGSTLLEQMLADHSRVSAGGELDVLPYIAQQMLAPFPESMATVLPSQLQACAARYLEHVAVLFPGAEFVTDKRPDNYLYIGLIKTLFPDAKIVHTVRDPLDTCLSIFFLHLDHRMSYALDLMAIGHHYRQYRRLMAHWQGLYGADILDVNYEALVREPNAVMETLLAFLGLEFEERCSTVPPPGRAIKTASVWQVREPLYRRSSGRARHYAQHLEALRASLEQVP